MGLYLADATFIDSTTLDVTRGPIMVESGPTGGIAFVDDVPADAEVGPPGR